MSYDFSQDKTSTFDVIPAKTVALVGIEVDVERANGGPENAFRVTDKGMHMLSLKVVVLEGEHARRQFWQNIMFAADPDAELTDGQQKSILIGRGMMRAILQAARGYAPSDKSPEALAALSFDSVFELNGMEFWAEIGVEAGTGTYPDKNVIRRVIPIKETTKTGAPSQRAAAAPPAQGNRPTQATRPAQAGQPRLAPAIKRPDWG